MSRRTEFIPFRGPKARRIPAWANGSQRATQQTPSRAIGPLHNLDNGELPTTNHSCTATLERWLASVRLCIAMLDFGPQATAADHERSQRHFRRHFRGERDS